MGSALAVNACEMESIMLAENAQNAICIGVARISCCHATFRRSQAKVQTGCAVDFSYGFRLLLRLLSWLLCGIYSSFLGGRVFEADLLLGPTWLLAAHSRVLQHGHCLVITATWQMQLDFQPRPTDFLAAAAIRATRQNAGIRCRRCGIG